MKKNLKYIVLMNLLFIQPVQAAEDFIKVAGTAGLCYASVFAPYYTLLTRLPEIAELEYQKNPDKYKVTDESLTSLIQQEAQKKGLDFSKFIVVKNVAPTMGVASPAGSVKYIFNVGSEEFLKEFSEMNAEGQKGIVQHELNHVIYDHLSKKIGVSAISNYIGFLVGYAALSVAANYTANYIEKNSAGNSSIASWIRKAQPFLSAGLGVYAGRCLDKKSAPVYSRYCEKQADLAVDDDPTVIKELIKSFQAYHDRKVVRLGEDFVKQNPEQAFGKDHPTPLERIAYLKEKLQQCSKDDKSGSF